MIFSEQRAANKISRILSRLDPEAAARIARSMAERFAVAAPETVALPESDAVRETAVARETGAARAKPMPEPPPNNKRGDTRPSFLQTEFRMAVGKELLDRERSGDKD